MSDDGIIFTKYQSEITTTFLSFNEKASLLRLRKFSIKNISESQPGWKRDIAFGKSKVSYTNENNNSKDLKR